MGKQADALRATAKALKDEGELMPNGTARAYRECAAIVEKLEAIIEELHQGGRR